MNLLVNEFLREISNDIKVKENVDDPDLMAAHVIIALGGLNKVINLCLTHSASLEDDKYCENAISSLHMLMMSDKDIDTTTLGLRSDHDHGVSKQNLKISQSDMEQVAPDSPSISMKPLPVPLPINAIAEQKTSNIDGRDSIIINTHDDNQRNQNGSPQKTIDNDDKCADNDVNNVIIAHSRSQFDAKSVVLQANIKNSLCYRWLGNQIGDHCANLVLYNKWYNWIMAILMVGSIIISDFIKAMNQSAAHSIIYLSLRGLSLLVASIAFIGLVSMMNFDVVEIIFHTFDFWFKTWNLVLWSISFIWINSVTTDRYISDLIFTSTCLAVGAMSILLLDAIPILYKVKRFLIILATILLVLVSMSAYFTYDDVLYNPFEKYNFKYTQISVKSMIMGSYFNIILFMAKPLFGDIKDALKPLVNVIKCKHDSDHDSDARVHDNCVVNDKNINQVTHLNKQARNNDISERLVSVYKRPKIQWNHASSSRMNQTNILAKHVQDH